jgi:predicted nucleic-acid-binding Zn-ribbon protein
MNENEAKTCPKCGGEMEIGNLHGVYYWQRGKSIWTIHRGRRIHGFACKKCGYVEFYLDKKMSKP